MNPDVMFVLETHTLNTNSIKSLTSLNIIHFEVIDPINHFGGIWIIWNDQNVQIEEFTVTERCAHIMTFFPIKYVKFMKNGVYFPTQLAKKNTF